MRFSEEEKTMWLEDWRNSGKSTWAYAKENGLNLQTLKKWVKAGTETKHRFVEVQSQIIKTQANATQPVPEILIEKGDVKIHIPLFIGCSELRAVMEGLGASI